jgi:hypothetical protein
MRERISIWGGPSTDLEGLCAQLRLMGEISGMPIPAKIIEEHLRGALQRLTVRERAADRAADLAAQAWRSEYEQVEAFDVRGSFVYLLLDDHGEPLYVGESGNVLARLGSHMSDPTKRRLVRHVKLIRRPSSTSRKALEKQLIGYLQPPLNVQGISR